MLIVSEAVSMNSAHFLRTTHTRNEKLQMWVGNEPPRENNVATSLPPNRPSVANPPVVIPEHTMSQKVIAGCEPEPNCEALAGAEIDRQAMDLVILMRTLGKSAEEVNRVLRGIAHFQQGTAVSPKVPEHAGSAPADQATNGPAGWGLIYDLHEERTEVEATEFSAQGTVRTADGRTLTFDVELAMQRVASEATDVSIRAGDAKKVDPLVLNLTQAPATFDGKQTFDLDGDGTQESIARLAAGSAYLALDKNGNGEIDSGQELFGPQSGNGFEELRTYDGDGNGWIDEGDAVFSQLQLWSPSVTSQTLTGLHTAGVGAICLDSVSTPFTMKNGSDTQAVVARTGIYLKENGEASTLQHVDLVV
jgi:hypothetical protein